MIIVVNGTTLETNNIRHLQKVQRVRFKQRVNFADGVNRYSADDYGIKVVLKNGKSITIWWNATKNYEYYDHRAHYTIFYDERDEAFDQLLIYVRKT